MTMDIGSWLRGLDLGLYEQAFRDNDIDLEILAHLTAEDLISIGVRSVGHRRKLLAAITALRGHISPLSIGSSTEIDTSIAVGSIVAERRQLTVMFCDLVASTALAGRLDPEDLHEVISAYHAAVADNVGRFDGFVAKYMGDGVLVYFGYPQAHEDDAERAVRAGLGVIDAVGHLQINEELQVRIGIATGLVVVGDLIGEGAAQERGVVGETPNLASRLQALAVPNTLIVSDGTRRQIGRLFDVEDLGLQRLAGFTAPQRAWRILRESDEVSRFAALRSGTTPLIGRDEQIKFLLHQWQRVSSGEGQVVLISGEPGIGKSRLTAELYQRIANEPHLRLRYYCSPHHQDSALHPVIVQIERAARFEREDTVEDRVSKLRALFSPGAGDDDIALLEELLSLPCSVSDLNLTPQRKRERLFETLLHQLESFARHQPVLITFEDVHWIDPTSRELLDLLAGRVRELRVLLLITFRPEFPPPWGGPHVATMTLNRLVGPDGEALVHNLAGNAALRPEIVAEIVERADGIPLFVEELTKAVLESGEQEGRASAVLAASPAPALAIPATLHASLIARLDRLGTVAKEVAQIGAVLGREFTYELIESLAQRANSALAAALVRLTDAGLLFCRGEPPDATYTFKHALVQDAAYQSLLRATRRHYHAEIARLFERERPQVAETEPELVAHHYTEAGDFERALRYWHQAGRRAARRSANAEAISHLTRGLEILRRVPETRERTERELEYQMTLGPVFIAMKGHGAREVGSTYGRARELCDKLGDTARLSRVLAGLCAYHTARGPFTTAYEIACQLLPLAEQRQEPRLLLTARTDLGVNAYLLGRFTAARDHLEHGMALADSLPHGESPLQDFGVTCYSYSSLTLFSLGYPDRALQRSRETVKLARDLKLPFSLAFALIIGSFLHKYRREPGPMLAYAEEGIALCKQQNFPLWLGGAAAQRGAALAELGHVEEAAHEIRQGLNAWLATGAEVAKSYFLGVLAEVERQRGNYEEALRTLDEGLAATRELGERFYEAELYRLKGDLSLNQESVTGCFRADEAEAAAEVLYRRALAIAQDQCAKAWELRAATSLARLWQKQNRRGEVRSTLGQIYERFAEGLDTEDLREARALLQALN
jgi:predicted ATPase/class 3 adenylate cyclase